MDDLIGRPMSLIISEREKYGDGPLSTIRSELTHKKYSSIFAWEKAVTNVLADPRFETDEVLKDISKDMQDYFRKKCEFLEDLNACHFKDILTDVSKQVKELEANN